ncbi:protein patched isoform X2 [Adelges cooleyi]|uniref:protein patched isoform X2 n=1 Tax=Adelges cooleyi TaxID=133065 RepID=UPI002180956E|nr:protein patched isoform X2 [Adelges cooleyi]
MLLLPGEYYKHLLESLLKHRIERGKAVGRLCAVRFRAWEQKCLERLGRSIHRKTHVFFLPLLLCLGVLLAGFKAFDRSSQFDQLWVESGGRLETELRYSESALGETESVIHLLVTQTAKEATSPEVPQQRLLHRKALLAHLQLLRAASHVTVNLFDVTWSLKDICVSPSPPDFEVHYIDTIFENMMPCEIITPLDCFWEGSKLLGPENPVTVPGVGNGIKWTNLNPQSLMKSIKAMGDTNFPFDMLETYMKRAGINSGYQEKLCLDPDDPDCPETSPNKKTKKIPDIGAELANGCRGFASKYMHWPKELLLGGIVQNKTGYIQKADALQSVLQLMGEKELYEFWSQSYKVLHFSWDQEKAALVLKTWQKKFNEEVKKVLKNSTMAPYNFFTFSTMLLNDLLSQYDFLDPKLIYIGCLIMVIYVSIMQINLFDAVRSQLIIGLFGLALVVLSIASGIAFCCLIGIQIHSATIAVVISIASALGVNNMFLLMFSYKRVSSHGFDRVTQKYSGHMGKKQVGMVLKSAGTSILMTSLITISTFMTAAVVPIPALRAFCLQVAILVAFVLATTLFGVTSLISFDVRRRRSARIDIFCCFPSEDLQWPFFNNTKQPMVGVADSTIDGQMRQLGKKPVAFTPAAAATSNFLLKDFRDANSDCEDNMPSAATAKTHCCEWTPRDIARKYVQYLTTGSCRIRVILSFLVVLGVSAWGITRIQAGLTLPEMVPNGTNEQKFLGTYGQMFGFYNMYAVTRGDFEYPTNQKLLYEYHDAFMRVPNILKNDNGGLPQMWLTLFKEWLLGLQKAFDKDWQKKCISQEGWDTCATENGILGYKLLVQTGNSDNPIDKSLASTARLVDENGIINEETFYNLLTAWASNDILAYGASQANIRPEPRRWTHVANDYDLQIVKSSPIIYAQMPFYASYLYDTTVITKFISTVRGICKQYDERGLPNYPSGIPFVYWEQYQELRQYLCVAMAFAFLFLFLIGGLFLCNVRAALISSFMSVVLVIQILGFMGFADIKFSAIPVVLLIGTVGTGVTFTIHLCLSFVTSIGNRHRRTHLSVDHMSKMVLQSGATLIIAVIMLVFQNNYVSRSYFLLLTAKTVFGLFNGLICLPVFLSMFGPPPEIKPLKYADRISTPSPEPIKKRARYTSVRQSVPPPLSSRSHHGHQQQHHHKHHHQQQQNNTGSSKLHGLHFAPRDGSLSTIAEESGSYHSASMAQLERSKSQMSLSRSPSPSLRSECCSTDSSSEDDAPQQRIAAQPALSTSNSNQTSAPTRCIVTAKFELELDGNVMSAAAQPRIHKSKHHHGSNRQSSKRHKRHHSNSSRY